MIRDKRRVHYTLHYTFEACLKPYAKMHVPLNSTFVSLVQKPMGILYGLEHDDGNVHVRRAKIEISKTDIIASDIINTHVPKLPFFCNKSKSYISVLIYEPKDCKEILPCLYFIHGGGFVFNAAPHHFALARRFTQELKVKTVLVDYRLAPKHKFPTAINDCLKVYEWLILNAKNLQIDPQNIVIVGDSAGGNLSAGIGIAGKIGLIPFPKAQMLLYPVLDRRMQFPSHKLYTKTPMCNSKDMEKYFRMYVGDRFNVAPSLVQYLSPLEASSLEGVPPTYIEVAQYDCLHDEGVQFAQALEKCRVPLELHEIEGAMHGYDIAQNSAFMNRIMSLRTAYLKKMLN